MKQLSLILSIFIAGATVMDYIQAQTPTVYVGTATIPNPKKDQDRIDSRYVTDSDKSRLGYFFGVYDGHGANARAAEHTQKSLFGLFQKNIRTDHNAVIAFFESLRAIEKTFQNPKNKKKLKNSGTTAVNAYVDIQRSKLSISNVGDSRAVVSQNGIAQQPLPDHDCTNDGEQARISETDCTPTYSCVTHGQEELSSRECPMESEDCRFTCRVGGNRFTRSLGDAETKTALKEIYGYHIILADPEIWSANLTPDIKFVILASDGVWDNVVALPISNQEAVDLVHEVLSRYPDRNAGTKAAAVALANLAQERVGFDDIAVVLITFDWPEGESSGSGMEEESYDAEE